MEKLSQEVIQKQQQRRIQHLETQILAFRNNIEHREDQRRRAVTMATIVTLRGGRQLRAVSFQEAVQNNAALAPGFVSLIPAVGSVADSEMIALLTRLLDMGASELCFVGPRSD